MAKKKPTTNQPKLDPLEWQTVKVRLGDLVPWEPNPRHSTEEQAGRIKKSIQKFNYSQLIEAEPGPDGTLVLVDGHQRKPVQDMLKGFGVDKEIEIRLANRPFTLDERREYIALKHKGAVGEFEPAAMRNLYQDPNQLVEFGFEKSEVEAMGFEFEPTPPRDADPTISQAVEFQKKWKVQPGDLWQVGRHRVYCGDATNEEHVARVLRGDVPGIMVSDPPYGVEYEPEWRNDYKGGRSPRMGKVANDDRASWAMAYALFPGDVAYLWHAGTYSSVSQRAIESVGFDIRAQIIWMKHRFAISRGAYHWRHETCWYAVRHGKKAQWAGSRKQQTIWADIVDHWTPDPDLYVAKIEEQTLLTFPGQATTVWDIPGGHEDMETPHSTQKALECMARPMRNHKFKIVYEPFLGSGTTLIAAENEGLQCLALELTPEYVAVDLERAERAFPGIEIKKIDPR